MPSTFTFNPINDGGHYDIADLNQFFRELSVYINRKLDAATEQELQYIVVGEAIVKRGGDLVLLDDPEFADILGDIQLSAKRLINLKRGEDSADAITVGQAKEILGLA